MLRALVGGWDLYEAAAHRHGDILNGLLLMAFGLGGLAWFVIGNVRKTDIVYGMGGSAIQIQLAILSYFAVAVVGLAAVVLLIGVLAADAGCLHRKCRRRVGEWAVRGLGERVGMSGR